MPTVTLNPNDMSSDLILSNGNLSVDSTAASGNFHSVRATHAKARGGKWYFEVTFRVDYPASPINGLGLISINHPLLIYRLGNYNPGAGSLGGVGLEVTGNLYYKDNDTSTVIVSSYMPQINDNETISVAYDMDSGRIWFAVEGTWIGGGTPGIGATPAVTMTGIKFTPVFPAIMSSTVNNSGLATARFATTDFLYSPPAGFSSIETAGNDFTFSVRAMTSSLSRDMMDGGASGIAGNVKEFGVSGRYRVRLHDQQTGRLIRETWSNSAGDYEFTHLDEKSKYVIAFDHTSPVQTAAIKDNVVPS